MHAVDSALSLEYGTSVLGQALKIVQSDVPLTQAAEKLVTSGADKRTDSVEALRR